ncbi:hypothetical protein [Spirulina sp. 06S082]|uniref:hypothetical protein n=1 Tax=Spirulina sp. 06S082 TaxID=3110248 RepID=UPI002B211589|nr:hypothetical protein [Spirulina sp. 06S082]MEA5470739.1 hypothetical protein [Spirulina sp. 06S082]
MTGQVLEKSAASVLVLILPFALIVVFVYSAWPLLVAATILGIIWQTWQSYHWKQWSQQVTPFFNQLLEEKQGCLTPIDLSVKANLKLEAAQRFLERKASEYGAQRQNYDAGNTVYYFLTANALGNIFSESEPDRHAEAMSIEEVAQFKNYLKPDAGDRAKVALIQAELAKRLDVHSGTISKRKADPSFTEWSKSKDPEGIAWEYSRKRRLFLPLQPDLAN